MAEIKEIIISNLKSYRKDTGISQAKLAEKCNLSTSYIAEIEMGRSYPSIKSLEAIAKALDIKTYQLLLDSEDTPTQNDLLNNIEKDITKSFESVVKSILNKHRN